MQPATGDGTAPPAKPAGSHSSWSNIGSSQYRRDPQAAAQPPAAAQPLAAEEMFADAQSQAASSHWSFTQPVAAYVVDVDDDVQQPPAAMETLADAQPQAAAYASADPQSQNKNIYICL